MARHIEEEVNTVAQGTNTVFKISKSVSCHLEERGLVWLFGGS